MTSELQRIVDDLPKVRRISYELVEPLVAPATAMSDDELMDFLKQLEPRAVRVLGELSPELILRVQEIVSKIEVPEKDDNRFERTFEEE